MSDCVDRRREVALGLKVSGNEVRLDFRIKSLVGVDGEVVSQKAGDMGGGHGSAGQRGNSGLRALVR